MFQSMSLKIIKSRLRVSLSHAFATDTGIELTEDDLALIKRVAIWLVKRKMGEAAVLSLDSLRPLNFVGSSAMTFLRPFVHLILKKQDDYDRFTRLLEDRGAIDTLLTSIEEAMNGLHSSGDEKYEK